MRISHRAVAMGSGVKKLPTISRRGLRFYRSDSVLLRKGSRLRGRVDRNATDLPMDFEGGRLLGCDSTPHLGTLDAVVASTPSLTTGLPTSLMSAGFSLQTARKFPVLSLAISSTKPQN